MRIRAKFNFAKQTLARRKGRHNISQKRYNMYIDVEEPIDPGAPCRGFL